MYENLVKLYSISTSGQNISLRNNLYRIRQSRDEDMVTYLVKISQIRDQLKGLWEMVSDFKMAICVLKDFPPNWTSFTTSIYSKNDTTPFNDLWAQCILEESRIKAKDDIE